MLIPFKDLFKHYGIKSTGVIHLGANTGQEADTYVEMGVKQVIWVEALPDICAQLHDHVRNRAGHHAVYCACLSDVNGEAVTFNVANNGGQSSSFLKFGTHAQEHPTVKFVQEMKMNTVRFDTLLEGFDLRRKDGWFLNVDLQGAELKAMRGMGDILKHCAHAYVEVNRAELYKGCPLVGDIDNFLLPFGFLPMETKWTGAGWGDRFYTNPGFDKK